MRRLLYSLLVACCCSCPSGAARLRDSRTEAIAASAEWASGGIGPDVEIVGDGVLTCDRELDVAAQSTVRPVVAATAPVTANLLLFVHASSACVLAFSEPLVIIVLDPPSRLASLIAVEVVRDCNKFGGKTTPRREASVANCETSCFARSCGTEGGAADGAPRAIVVDGGNTPNSCVLAIFCVFVFVFVYVFVCDPGSGICARTSCGSGILCPNIVG